MTGAHRPFAGTANASGHGRSLSRPARFGLILLAIGLSGCAITQPSSDPWTLSYVGSPDAVWSAIHVALINLDYDVESENRNDGVIRALRGGTDDAPAAILSIDQVMRSDDVKVFIRVAAAPEEPAFTFDQREAAAEEFRSALEILLYP